MAQPGDAPRPGDGSGDWTVQAADTIERVVVGIRDKTSVPLTTLARVLVYGLLVAVMGLIIGIFLTVVSFRVLSAYAFRGNVWASYLLVGGIINLAGVLLLRKAKSTPKRKSAS